MADVKIIPTVAETREGTTASPDTRLNQLTDTVVKNGRKAFAAAAFAVLSTVSGSAYAADTPNTPSTSANASADKRAGQVVNLKDGRVMSFTDIAKLKGAEKDAVIDGMSDAEYTKYEKFLDESKQAANQRIDGKKEALDQINALHNLMDQLFTEQGLQISGDKKYESQAIVVRNVLNNPILTEKFTPDTISLLKDMEGSLSRGKNPFIYMSPSGKAKLRAMLKA